jgi:Right handed beta helix region
VLALAAGVALVLILRPHRGPGLAQPPVPPARPQCHGEHGHGEHNQGGQRDCRFPGPASTGVPASVSLRAVPGQVSSGPGWSYDPAAGSVNVTGDGAVLSGLAIDGTLNITASHVTVADDRITATGNFGISLRHTAGVTIEDSTISGQNATSGRVSYAIDDIYGDSAGTVITGNNISDWRVGINATTGQITGNYIHDPGYLAGDHTDGIYDQGGTGQLTISGNTVLNSLGQTCAIMLESAPGQPVANKTISGNLLAGGDYVIYAGGSDRDSSHIVITGNRFGQQYYPASGRYGPVAQFQPDGTGNAWSGNVWTSHAQLAAIRLSQVSGTAAAPGQRGPGRHGH